MIAAFLSALLALQASGSPAVEHLHAGVAAEKSGQLDAALAEFQKASELDPKLAIAFTDVGGVYIEKRDYASAIPPLKQAIALSPNLEAAHRLLEYALLTQGYATEAIPHLEQAHAEDALGIALLDAGKLPEAVAVLQKSLAQSPDDPELLYYYGRASGLLSKQVFDQLEARFPDSARAHEMMAQDYAVLRDVPAAEREFFAALRLRPQTAGLHLQLGELYARAQQWDKAEEQFRLETELQPGSAEAFYRLGEARMQLDKIHEARETLVHSDQFREDMPETLYQLGKAAAMDGDETTAQQSWQHLLSMEKNTALAAQAHFGLAGIYRKQGKRADADREMQEFHKLQSKPGHTDVSPK